jgi:hypothetical protein
MKLHPASSSSNRLDQKSSESQRQINRAAKSCQPHRGIPSSSVELRNGTTYAPFFSFDTRLG